MDDADDIYGLLFQYDVSGTNEKVKGGEVVHLEFKAYPKKPKLKSLVPTFYFHLQRQKQQKYQRYKQSIISPALFGAVFLFNKKITLEYLKVSLSLYIRKRVYLERMMFMKKYVSVFLLLLIFCTVLAGCGKKEPINAESFNDIMTDKGYLVLDSAELYDADTSILESSYIAVGDGYQIEFLEFKKEKDAKYSYGLNVEKFKSNKGSSHLSSSKDFFNYSTFNLTSDDHFYIVSRIDNTLIYSEAPEEFKDEIKKVFEELGY